MARFFREDFDQAREFVVLRPFKHGGKDYQIGDPLNKEAFPLRTLRQLYDMRNTDYPSETDKQSVPQAPPAPLPMPPPRTPGKVPRLRT